MIQNNICFAKFQSYRLTKWLNVGLLKTNVSSFPTSFVVVNVT